jgi:hypothetical protein
MVDCCEEILHPLVTGGSREAWLLLEGGPAASREATGVKPQSVIQVQQGGVICSC